MFREAVARQKAISAWAATSGLGIAVGPIAAGVLLAHFWWGSVFLINLPVAALGFALALPLVPDSKNPARPATDPVGAGLSIAGLGLLLWAIIEAPTKGWTSTTVLGAGLGGLAVLGVFIGWEHASTHPMLNLNFFRSRRFSAATSTAGLNMFALFGAMFVLTQFLQFELGFTPLQAGIRILPVAAVLAAAAPCSAVLVRLAGTKVTVAAGLTAVAGGLWQLSTADTGATYGTSLQVGGALGVAVVGSLLSTRYQDQMTAALALYHLPSGVMSTLLGSIGGALQIAAHQSGQIAAALTALARSSFMSGMHLGLLAAAAVAAGGIALTLLALP